ncbi:hypothetical protein FRB94_001940 [Tulasnella sp. JGI-2019a]|nr:hypothetical protein FRB93_005750 [Tulasnella sp. JGI-2019a]KAG9004971.1 hypothetical protein FRB94_001940 [Tulasnella sp. JGI-2019a]KAG9038096.1 hypothetical protein FRB95_003024 [Tulasnella sp. JGI-2019a]
MSNSTPIPMTGFKAFGKDIDYEEYTSLPLTTIYFDRPMMAAKYFRSLNFTMYNPGEIPPLKDTSFISVDDLLLVKDSFEPIFNLDLLAAESAGMVPKALIDSKPHFNRSTFHVTSFAQVCEYLNDHILTNIHYAFRLYALFLEINRVQTLGNSMIKVGNKHFNTLVNHEATTAFDCQWYEMHIFAHDNELNLAHRLWADGGVVRDLMEGRTPAAATGAVLLSYVPHWMVGEDVLTTLGLPVDGHSNAPSWFGGLHASCKRWNVQYLVIYTGVHLVIITFDAKFDTMAMSQPIPVYCGQEVGYGIDETTGLPRASFSSMPVCLGQVITKLMFDAREDVKAAEPEPEPVTPIATSSSSQAPINSLPFPLTGSIASATVPPPPPAPKKRRAPSTKTSNKKNGHPYTRPPSAGGPSFHHSPPPPVIPGKICSAPRSGPKKMVRFKLKRKIDDLDLDAEPVPPPPRVPQPQKEERPTKLRKIDLSDNLVQRLQKFRDDDTVRQQRLARERDRKAAEAQAQAKRAPFSAAMVKETAVKVITTSIIIVVALALKATRTLTRTPRTTTPSTSTGGVYPLKGKKSAKSLKKARICGAAKIVKGVGTVIATGARRFAKAVARETGLRMGDNDSGMDYGATVGGASGGNASRARQGRGEEVLEIEETEMDERRDDGEEACRESVDMGRA